MELINQLPQYGGILGTLLAIALVALGWSVRELKSCWSAALTHYQAVQQIAEAFRATMREQAATSEQRSRAQEAMARAQEMTAHTQIALTEEVKRLNQTVEKQAAEIQKLREHINTNPRTR